MFQRVNLPNTIFLFKQSFPYWFLFFFVLWGKFTLSKHPLPIFLFFFFSWRKLALSWHLCQYSSNLYVDVSTAMDDEWSMSTPGPEPINLGCWSREHRTLTTWPQGRPPYWFLKLLRQDLMQYSGLQILFDWFIHWFLSH